MKKIFIIISLLFLTHHLAAMVALRTLQMPFKFILNSCLAQSVIDGDIMSVRIFLKLHADPLAQITMPQSAFFRGRIIVCFALMMRDHAIIKELLKVIPPDVLTENAKELLPLSYGNIRILKLLFRSGMSCENINFYHDFEKGTVKFFAALGFSLPLEIFLENGTMREEYLIGKMLYSQRYADYLQFLEATVQPLCSQQLPGDVVNIIAEYSKVPFTFGDLLLDEEEREKKKLVPAECVTS